MSTNARSMVVGVFTDEAQAQQAMNDLQQAGFSTTRFAIRYAEVEQVLPTRWRIWACQKMKPLSTIVSLKQAIR